MDKTRSYHFSCGDSTAGPVGFCARVRAASKQEAVEILQGCIPESISLEHALEFTSDTDAEQVEYFEVYLNPNSVTIQDIDEEDE